MNSNLKTHLKKNTGPLGDIQKKRLAQWREESTVQRLDRPTRIDRARSLGYKAKQGFCVARVKVGRGARKIPKIVGGRRPRRAGRFFTLGKSKQQVAEEKAATKFTNMEVLNSYWVGEDGRNTWYEVVLIDRCHPSVLRDRNAASVIKSGSRRAFRGKTAAGRKSRGLLNKARKG